jgi:hypothetical protein
VRVGTIKRVGTRTYNRIMIRGNKVGLKSSGIYTLIPSCLITAPLISSTLLRLTESEAYFDGITPSIDRSHSSIPQPKSIPPLDPP